MGHFKIEFEKITDVPESFPNVEGFFDFKQEAHTENILSMIILSVRQINNMLLDFIKRYHNSN
jgi:hypothetical protein